MLDPFKSAVVSCYNLVREWLQSTVMSDPNINNCIYVNSKFAFSSTITFGLKGRSNMWLVQTLTDFGVLFMIRSTLSATTVLVLVFFFSHRVNLYLIVYMVGL